jgi:hypothetical protein
MDILFEIICYHFFFLILHTKCIKFEKKLKVVHDSHWKYDSGEEKKI